MQAWLKFKRIWSDDDLIEFQIETKNLTFMFQNKVYVDPETFHRLIFQELQTFRTQISGGIYDLELGSFGNEYAGGGLSVRLQFTDRAKIRIFMDQESEFQDVLGEQVADRGRFHLTTEPALLDRFIEELNGVFKMDGTEAILECLPREC